MILVKTNRQEFPYDIHSLVKAFFQEEDVIVSAGEKNDGAEPKIEISITFEKDGIESRFRGCSGGSASPEAGDAVCRPENPDDYKKSDFREGALPVDDGVWQELPGGSDNGKTQTVPDSDADTEAVRRDRIELAGADAEDRGSRKIRRNALKTLLYRQLRDVTGRALPWGNLTGIRPTKIPMDLLEEGASEGGCGPLYAGEVFCQSGQSGSRDKDCGAGTADPPKHSFPAGVQPVYRHSVLSVHLSVLFFQLQSPGVVEGPGR